MTKTRRIPEPGHLGDLTLTPLRAAVLEAIQKQKAPIGAYEIAADLSSRLGRRLYPATIYRVLDHLLGIGAIMRVESRNAYMAVASPADGNGLLFICDSCGAAAAVADDRLNVAVETDAVRLGFSVGHRTLEIRGLCRDCQPHSP